jgi:hypothetical protein
MLSGVYCVPFNGTNQQSVLRECVKAIQDELSFIEESRNTLDISSSNLPEHLALVWNKRAVLIDKQLQTEKCLQSLKQSAFCATCCSTSNKL